MSDPAGAAPKERKYSRIKTSLPGRYLLADGRENKCMIIDVSPGGIAVRARNAGAIGDGVVVYVDQIGRVEGRIVRMLADEFAVEITGSRAVAERIAARLAELRDVRRPLARV